jgi:hypothetical protein
VHFSFNRNRTRYQRTGKVLATQDSGGTVEGSLAGLDADGFTVNWTSARACRMLYLALSNCRVDIGTLTQPTSPGTQTVTIDGVNPALVLLLSINNIASSSNEFENRYSFGASDGTRQRGTWAGDNHGAFPTLTAVYQSSTSALAMATPAASSSTMNAEASLGSFTDGFTVTWSTVDSTQREVLYVSVTSMNGTAYIDGNPGTLIIEPTDRSVV